MSKEDTKILNLPHYTVMQDTNGTYSESQSPVHMGRGKTFRMTNWVLIGFDNTIVLEAIDAESRRVKNNFIFQYVEMMICVERRIAIGVPTR